MFVKLLHQRNFKNIKYKCLQRPTHSEWSSKCMNPKECERQSWDWLKNYIQTGENLEILVSRLLNRLGLFSCENFPKVKILNSGYFLNYRNFEKKIENGFSWSKMVYTIGRLMSSFLMHFLCPMELVLGGCLVWPVYIRRHLRDILSLPQSENLSIGWLLVIKFIKEFEKLQNSVLYLQFKIAILFLVTLFILYWH